MTQDSKHNHMHHDEMDHDHSQHEGHDHTSMEHDHSSHEGHDHTSMEHDHSSHDHSTMEHHHDEMTHNHHDHESHDHPSHEDHDHSQHEGHDHSSHHAGMVEDFKKRFWVSLILTLPILALSPMIQMWLGVDWSFTGDSVLLFALSTVLFIYGGKPFLTGAVDELKQKQPAMMTLIAMAIIVAYAYSTATVFLIIGNDFFWELATLIDIMLLGHWIEMRSVIGASKALDELVKLMPEEAHLISADGQTTDVSVKELKHDDAILVKPGEKVPIDGIIFEGRSSVDESMMTGESVPVEKGSGDEIIGGSINGEGILKFRVTKTGSDTFISQVIKLVTDAQASKSKTQRLADIAAGWLFYIALGAGVLTFIVWTLLGEDIGFTMERVVTVMIIACPHALGLATPLVTAVSTSIAAQRGLLIRDRTAFEEARKLNTVVFDKTGTLTQGEFGITDWQAYGVKDEELLQISYTLEANSEHPIAKGIVKRAQEKGTTLLAVDNFSNMTGQGLRGTIDGKEYAIVSPGTLKTENIHFDEETYQRLATEGKTVVFVTKDKELIGMIALADIVRDTAIEAIQTLKDMGIESIMMTGDNKTVAHHVGKQLQIDRILAEVLPQDKSSEVAKLQAEGRVVGMTGDGVNDAPALAQANLGIAIGAGTDVAIATADVILVKSNPLDVVNILKLSKATYRKMIQNLVWATAYNIIALPLAAGILYNQGINISPAVGAIMMSLSTIIVAINARLLKID